MPLEDYRRAIGQLGWLSAYSRQVILARQMLRCIIDVDEDEFASHIDLDKVCLTSFRAAITIFSSTNFKSRIFSSPYTPEDRPETFYLALNRGLRFFEISVTSGRSSHTFFDKENNGVGYESRYTDKNDKLFVQEVTETISGVNLSTKIIADERAEILCGAPLGGGGPNRDDVHGNNWFVSTHLTQSESWSFWREWYVGLLKGKTIDFEFQAKIALIDNAVWDAGPEAVATEIERIQAEMFLIKAPQVEEVYENSDGLYDVRATVLDPSKLVQSVIDRVSFALSLALDSNHCDLNSMSVAAKMLRHALENCPDDPNALEQWLRNANGLISKGIEGANLAESDELDALISTLTETALQLRADHPEVGEAVKTRTAQRLREITAEKRETVASRMDAMVDGTGVRLRAEYQLDAEITRDGSDVDATAEAMQRSGNRAQKISLAERAKKVEGSGAMSVAKIGMRAKSLVEIVASLFSGIG
ncbi:hypothetical protein [Ascidiaceihabitans sp.]|uniref:hypothetical protein n=1 Tax=Ascidiaceihabitans sp. TaxID=1872644 RepID=UPI003298B83B